MLTRLGIDAKTSPNVDELSDEIHMAFGSGTQLLELYVTPQLLTPRAWDVLAQCAHWARANADVLVDVHWVGGDPGKGEPYGYAAWSPRKGILVLRNPSDKPQTLQLTLQSAFELPPEAPATYTVNRLWAEPAARQDWPKQLAADETHAFQLAPFEVLVLEAVGTP